MVVFMLLLRYQKTRERIKMENTMGMRIKQLRLQAHMTQEELGKVIGVNKAAIQKYESGQTMNMKRNKIAALSKFFKVSPTWLMGFDEEQDNQPETKQENHEIDCDLIDACFGKDAYKLVQTFLKLNDVGQAKAIEYLSDLADNAKYTEGREGAKQKLA